MSQMKVQDKTSEIYGIYMQIIKALVRATTGNADAEEKPVKETATKFNKKKEDNAEEVEMKKA